CVTASASQLHSIEGYKQKKKEKIHSAKHDMIYHLLPILLILFVAKKLDKYVHEEPMIRGPGFLVRLRSHTVFENTPVKLFCTVEGFPLPVVKWYKEGVALNLSSGKYLVETKGGSHSLEIPRCSTDDTAQYTAVASNIHGQASCQASVIVKTAMLPQIHYTKICITFVEKFGPVFATEGDSATLSASMTLSPNLANLQPEAQWYRDDIRLSDSKWVKIETGRGFSTLSLPNLYKDDEGVYTLRMVTKGGTAEHSAFVSVADGPAPVPAAPGAPMDIKIHDANRDYVIVSWKPPNTTTEGPILGYFVDKCEVGTENWSQCNDHPIKICKYPVSGLFEGHSYYFRVRAVNSHGISKPSRMTYVVLCVPSAPGQVISTRETNTSVLIQWSAPKEPNNLIGYYIDQCVLGSKNWTSANHKPHKKTSFVVSGLTTGESYMFRVQAINELGLSDESQESAPLTVKAALTTPSAPYDIAVLNCDGHSMVLNWKKPLHSGGAEIKEYYVDKRRSGTTMWREVNIPPVKERVYKVEGLTSGAVYQFQVYAANLAGLGPVSKPSADYTCEAWNMPEPGPAYDMTFCEVRDDSLVIEWQKPIYTGSGPITGYHVEYAKKGSNDWTRANETSVSHRFMKVTGLETGTSYAFRVRAANAAGVGMASMPSDPVTAKAIAGSQEVSCVVDEKSGNIILSFEACQMNVGSQFMWKKDYKEVTDFSKGIEIKTEGNKEDVGTFSVSTTNTDGVSSSYTISDEEMARMLALSYELRHPIIPLKSELAYKILERGRMRFWLQAEEISPKVTYKFFANNKELSGPDKMGHDVATGIIEFIMDHFTVENEGTFTCQITDGGGKAQSSLVLIGNAFKTALAEADYQRREYIRVKEGPHFSEFLSLQVGDDCSVNLVCKVANLKKESVFHWFKEDTEIIPDVKPDLGAGVCKLPIKQFSLETTGIYKATISDDRGKDMSQINVSGKGKHLFLFQWVCTVIGASAAELVINCTGTGIQLQCHMKYYTPEMNITWYHSETKLTHSNKNVIGGTPAMATMEVIEPTDKDKGLYTIEIASSDGCHKRILDLSGNDRGQVIGGLPDVVTIMEKKTLSLTCTVCGDPKPQVSWLKNGAEVEPDDQVITWYCGKFASLTIKRISVEDSGRYSMIVQNKYGGESVDIVVSVYRHGEKIPEAKPTLTPKTIIPPKLPIEIPQPKTQAAPSPAPSTPSPPKAAPGRGVKSPTPTRRK
uniref:Myomesin-2-like n=1 Tax=Gouania willdenowi TaxID=441366 RepID=A0A8C5DBT2_GOUWI